MKYFVASRWRNAKQAKRLISEIRTKGWRVFSFFENRYNRSSGENPEIEMRRFESTPHWRKNKQIRNIFKTDIKELKSSDVVILLLPAGRSAHIEAGIAYGLGKKLILIGSFKKAETHYLIFDEFYNSIDEFINSLPSKR